MKKSIASIITKKVLLMLLIAITALLGGAYFTVYNIVSSNVQKHAQTIAGIYADTVVYLANKEDVPIDKNFTKEIDIVGEYMCKWYGIDAATLYIPNFKEKKINYISFSYNEETFKDIKGLPKAGDVLNEDNITKDEKNVWDGKQEFAHIDMTVHRFHELATVYCSHDAYNNKFLVAVTTNYTEIRNQIITFFSMLVAVIALVALGIYLRIKNIIKKKVSEPSKEISNIMNSYIGSENSTPVKMNDYDNAEFSMISSAYNSMLDDINEYINNIKVLNNEKMKQAAELSIASNIQQGFLPNSTINANDYYIQCMMKPARNVGGDLYDYIELDENRTLVVIADVSGKGITSAIVMAITLVLIREYAKFKLSPAEILEKVNDTLSAKNPAMQFVTAFIGIYDRRNKTLVYSNAGHNAPYIISDKLSVVENPEGSILGLFNGEKYINKTLKLKTGDTLFMYTDGVTEITNKDKKFFGIDNLEKELEKYVNANTTNLVDNIFNTLNDFSGEAEQFDDITMLTLTIKDTTVVLLDYDIKEFSKIKGLILDLPLEKKEALDLCLAAEEIFVNICNYAFPQGAPKEEKILFALSQADSIILRFEDGGKEFNPLEQVKTDIDYDPDAQIGGLGIFMTNKVVDEIKHDYINNKNIISLIKKCNTN